MSDMYLELKSRIPVVAARTHIGTARLQELQDARGLSNERLARLIPVSEKTWRRWKESGEIPTYALQAVAPVLGLDLRGATTETLELEPTVPEVLQRLESLESSVESLRQVVLAALKIDEDAQASR
jgi:transcriptional regulator with XRE-family HTH domain